MTVATIIQLEEERVAEKSTPTFQVSFVDESGVAVIPLTATWSLKDVAGTVVNSRSAVSMAPMASTKNITLAVADTTFGASENGPLAERKLIVEYTYTSDMGIGLSDKVATRFFIERIL
jgi:hypothetical protein